MKRKEQNTSPDLQERAAPSDPVNPGNQAEYAEPAYPRWFRILVPVLCVIILAGGLYGVFLRLRWSRPAEKTGTAGEDCFEMRITITPDDTSGGTKQVLAAVLKYDYTQQHLTVRALSGKEAEQAGAQSNTVRMTETNFCAIVDKAGGIPDPDGEGTLSGAEAYALAQQAPQENVPALILSLLEAMRMHSNDAAFMLRLMTFSATRIDSNLSLKTLGSVGKNILKADTLTMEVAP